MPQADVSRERVDAVGEVFNSNDIDAVMPFFADDAIFGHRAGPEVFGTRFQGRAALRGVFGALFDNVGTVHRETLDITIAGSKACREYRREAVLKSGEVREFLSLDVLTVRDGLIAHKDTYYKNRTP